jgi:V-type H+-transporting ATPase subunit A
MTTSFIKDDYLQQNSFTKYDRYCPFYKSVEMMRNIAIFHRMATAAVEKTAGGNAEVRSRAGGPNRLAAACTAGFNHTQSCTQHTLNSRFCSSNHKHPPPQGQKITYNVIKQRLGDVLYKLTSQKFEDPCECLCWGSG